jgi:RNA polymerase sigma-70 factor (ECF subfamily)
MSSLPAEQRRVIELAYFDGLTQTEIASLLQEPLGTVKTRVRLAMAKLADLLGDEEGA